MPAANADAAEGRQTAQSAIIGQAYPLSLPPGRVLYRPALYGTAEAVPFHEARKGSGREPAESTASEAGSADTGVSQGYSSNSAIISKR